MELDSTTTISIIPIILFIFSMIMVIVYYLLTSNHKLFKKMGIDSAPTSVLGHFHLGIKYGVFESQIVMYNKFKDKKVFGWFNFTVPSMVICDLDLIKAVMVKHFNSFADRSSNVEYEPPFRDILLNLKGENWKRVRSIVSPTFSSGRIKKMSPHIEQNAKRLLEYLKQKQESGEDVELKEMCGKLALDVIASIAFGLDINSLKNPDNRFASEAGRVVKPNLHFIPLFLLFPKFKRLFSLLGISVMAKKPMQYLTDAIDATIEERRREGTVGKINDFLDLVMNAEKDDEMNVREPLTRSELHAQSLIFLFAGLDSISTVMSFTLFLLAVHPDCCQKAQEELDEKLAGDAPDFDNIQSLEYLEMCINEAIRMAPPGYMLDRKCVEPIDIDGISFPKNMVIVIPVYAIHNDPDIWPEPDRFIPERFTEENKKSRHPFAFLPFGQGPRNCIGLRLAMLELKIAIATFLQKYTPISSSKTVFPFKLYKSMVRAVDGTWVKVVARQ